ncbi:MAG TPA: hypothetical protein VF765_02240 [Polyangiaceae bacterium]
MSRVRGLLVLAIVSSAPACLVTESLNGLTGGGGSTDAESDGATEAAPDVAPDMTADDGPSNDASEASDASPDVTDADMGTDASEGGSSGDVVQPDVVTGPVSCSTASALLCEDFENGLDTNKWQTSSSYATAVVDSTQHHRGASALHVNMPALETDGSLVDVAGNIRHWGTTLPAPVYIRAFVMFSSAQPQGTNAFFVGQQNASPYYGLQLEINQQSGDYAVTDWTPSSLYQVSTTPAAPTTWNCIEWELEPAVSGTTATSSDVWINGNEVSSLHLASTPISDLEVLGFGIGFYQQSSLPAYDEWIDDIFVDTSPVGCVK